MPRILLAEDEEVLRMLIVDSLEEEGHEIRETSNGLEAYERLLAEDFDLIIVDYMMPKMTGIELIKLVRQHPEKGSIPILMLTAKAQQRDQEEAIAAGANYFLAKPFSPMHLLQLTEDILNA
ncbi:response regulator [Ammoniphilus sp. CFH 90114]|uniref:response regulator n=1 Tax=Ammoniphilus sp. CFH 90114 TaxID=2493665 RepID=UPI00100E2768|nr:response regulator [Ammoniphilus sp. CFH 90114]RXT06273.1 response regulator [Ammoniphilus sp. CFH 90114]